MALIAVIVLGLIVTELKATTEVSGGGSTIFCVYWGDMFCLFCADVQAPTCNTLCKAYASIGDDYDVFPDAQSQGLTRSIAQSLIGSIPSNAHIFVLRKAEFNYNTGYSMPFGDYPLSGNSDSKIEAVITGSINEAIIAPPQNVVFSTTYGGFIGYFIPATLP